MSSKISAGYENKLIWWFFACQGATTITTSIYLVEASSLQTTVVLGATAAIAEGLMFAQPLATGNQLPPCIDRKCGVLRDGT